LIDPKFYLTLDTNLLPFLCLKPCHIFKLILLQSQGLISYITEQLSVFWRITQSSYTYVCVAF